jgi:MFS family permease
VGRRPLYLWGTIGIIAFGFPMFLLVHTGIPVVIVLVYIVGLAVLHDMLAASQGAWFSELFNASTRTSGASIGYQFSASLSGFIPLIAAAVAASFGWTGVAWVYMICGGLGLLAALVTRETWNTITRRQVDKVIAGESTSLTPSEV